MRHTVVRDKRNRKETCRFADIPPGGFFLAGDDLRQKVASTGLCVNQSAGAVTSMSPDTFVKTVNVEIHIVD